MADLTEPCPNCGQLMRWETSHERCDGCGYIRPCCEGGTLPDSVTAASTDRLTPDQRACVERWLPGLEVVHDHSWNLVGTIVLEAYSRGQHVIVKAFEEGNGHFVREVRAHREWLGPWVSAGRAPSLLRVDEPTRVLVTQHLAGELVQGSGAELRDDTYRQAGELLADLHGQLSLPDHDYWVRERDAALAWLGKPHRIDPEIEDRVRRIVTAWPTPSCQVVPTHGDWQPRNWLVESGVVSVIDFGRAALRPAFTDFSRLAAQQFLADPRREAAFLAGYGSDPREEGGWERQCLREAIGTAVWAHQVGDVAFEEQGHRMIAAALSHSGTDIPTTP